MHAQLPDLSLSVLTNCCHSDIFAPSLCASALLHDYGNTVQGALEKQMLEGNQCSLCSV